MLSWSYETVGAVCYSDIDVQKHTEDLSDSEDFTCNIISLYKTQNMRLIMLLLFKAALQISQLFNRKSVFLGDFFKDPLPDADLYILARIIHDWTDQRCVELLQRVHAACRPGLYICPAAQKNHHQKKGMKGKMADCVCVCVFLTGNKTANCQFSTNNCIF